MDDRSNLGGPPSGGSPRTAYWLTDGPLPYGRVEDMGVLSYDEFACSRSTLSMLCTRWTDVHLQVMQELAGGHNVIVKAWPK